MTPLQQVFVGVAILVLGGLLLTGLKWLVAYTVNAIARAIVKAINGQLGLDALRSDVSDLKVQFVNIEQQFEKILTDL